MTSAELDPDSDRLQDWQGGYLWHRSHPDCYLVGGPEATGEFIRIAIGEAGETTYTPTGLYFLNADRFTYTAPAYGNGFWLKQNDAGQYTPDNYLNELPDDDLDDHSDAVWVPWEHIVLHLYEHLMSFTIKEAHTFWPYGTTEADVLADLCAALNNDGVSPETGAAIAWDGEDIKTFFQRQPEDPTDRYTPEQLSDLADLFT